jgi:uncharacterized membrane protein
MHFILSDLKCYDSVLPQALEIIFEMQRKRNNEKVTRKKQTFQLTRHFSFLLFGPLILSNLITFLFHIHFKRFKVL